MQNRAYYVQRLLVDKLNEYKGRGNNYVDKKIKEMKDKKQWKDEKEKRVQDKDI